MNLRKKTSFLTCITAERYLAHYKMCLLKKCNPGLNAEILKTLKSPLRLSRNFVSMKPSETFAVFALLAVLPLSKIHRFQ